MGDPDPSKPSAVPRTLSRARNMTVTTVIDRTSEAYKNNRRTTVASQEASLGTSVVPLVGQPCLSRHRNRWPWSHQRQTLCSVSKCHICIAMSRASNLCNGHCLPALPGRPRPRYTRPSLPTTSFWRLPEPEPTRVEPAVGGRHPCSFEMKADSWDVIASLPKVWSYIRKGTVSKSPPWAPENVFP